MSATGYRLLRSISEVADEATNIDWAVKRLIPEASLGVIYGDSQSFKTFVAIAYLMHRAYGLPWCGIKTKPGVGVFVSAEGSGGIWKRIKAWHDHRGMDYRQCPVKVVPAAIQIPQQLGELRRDIDLFIKERGHAPSDCIIDTFSQTFDGDENKADNVATYLNECRRNLVEPYRMTVPIIHHTGHAGENPRGSYVWLANLDWRLKMERGKGDRITTMTVEKQKDENELPPLSFNLPRLQIGVDSDGEPITSLVAEYITDATKFVAAINEQPHGQQAVLLKIADLSPTVDQARELFMSRIEGKPSAKRQAWSRTRKQLTSAGAIEEIGGILMRRNTAKSVT